MESPSGDGVIISPTGGMIVFQVRSSTIMNNKKANFFCPSRHTFTCITIQIFLFFNTGPEFTILSNFIKDVIRNVTTVKVWVFTTVPISR